jgi:hypothetical protein
MTVVMLAGCQGADPPRSGQEITTASGASEAPEDLIARSLIAVEDAASASFLLDFDMTLIDVREPFEGKGQFTGTDYTVSLSHPDGESAFEVAEAAGVSYVHADMGDGQGAVWHESPDESQGLGSPFNPLNYLGMLDSATFTADEGLAEIEGNEVRELVVEVDALVFAAQQYGIGIAPEMSDEANPDGKTVAIRVWIATGSGLPAKMRIEQGSDMGWGEFTFFDWGEELSIAPPL